MRYEKSLSEYLLKGLAELIGTAILVFVGCMSCVFGLGEVRDAALLNTSIGFGIAVMMSVQTFGCISQAHINPSVTVACLILDIISIPMACAYFVAQCLGSLLGFGLLILVTPLDLKTEDFGVGVCTTVLSPFVSQLQGVFVEFLITGILIVVVCGALHPRNAKNLDSIAIRFGLTIWVLALAAAPYTCASMNPARSLGPAIWNSHYNNLWIYFVGPLAGSAVFSFMYKMLFITYAPPPPHWVGENVEEPNE